MLVLQRSSYVLAASCQSDTEGARAGINGTNTTKQPCPLVNGTAVPAIRPVAVPEITSLQGGQIMVGVNTTVPTQIKVIQACPCAYCHAHHAPPHLSLIHAMQLCMPEFKHHSACSACFMLSVEEARRLEDLQVGSQH